MSFWQRKRVLVTGANGFIGSAVCKRLGLQGAEVTALTRSPNDIIPALVDRVIGDVTDHDLLRDLVSAKEFDAVYHFAARSIVRTSARDPLSTYSTNVMGTVALLEALRIVGGVRSIVVASSDKAYGDHDDLPYVETHPLVPRNTYDTSKACADMIAQSYAHNYGLPISVTRCSNVYGPGDRNFSRLVPNTVVRLLSGQSPIIYEDISDMEREFVFIDDVAHAYDLLGEKPTVGECFNIGGTGPAKIKDFVELICKHAGYKAAVLQVVKRESSFKEIQRQYIDAEKIARHTGWRWSTTHDVGIIRTIEHYRRFL